MFEAYFSPTLMKWREPGLDEPDWLATWVSLTEDGIKAVAPKSFRWSRYNRIEECEVNQVAGSPGGYVMSFHFKPRVGLDVFWRVKSVRVPANVSMQEAVGILKFKGVRVIQPD